MLESKRKAILFCQKQKKKIKIKKKEYNKIDRRNEKGKTQEGEI